MATRRYPKEFIERSDMPENGIESLVGEPQMPEVEPEPPGVPALIGNYHAVIQLIDEAMLICANCLKGKVTDKWGRPHKRKTIDDLWKVAKSLSLMRVVYKTSEVAPRALNEPQGNWEQWVRSQEKTKGH